eukprot:1156762-Pelagomonas_calceolata.AAC.4
MTSWEGYMGVDPEAGNSGYSRHEHRVVPLWRQDGQALWKQSMMLVRIVPLWRQNGQALRTARLYGNKT